MMRKSLLGIGVVAALIWPAVGALAQGKTSKAAQTFITKAVQGNQAEVAMGQLAQQNAASDEVKKYGQRLVKDHTAAGEKATAAAAQMGVTPPTEPSRKQKADHAKMAQMSGEAFDRAFVRHMVADHKKEVAAHKKAARMKDEAAASYAAGALPALEQHLEMAQELNKSVGAKGSGKRAM
jgi:putative membrane protein